MEAYNNNGIIPSLPQVELDQIFEGDYANLSYPLTDWHRTDLENISHVGIECLIYMWFTVQPSLEPGTFCNATWDNFYCWPPTPAGETVTRPCSLILEATYGKTVANQIKGEAIRICQDNATWLWGKWTNFTTCPEELEAYEKTASAEYEAEMELVVQVRYILFIGSILSFVCLVSSLFVFFYFKCLRCDRVTVHVHLMVALTLRCVMLVVITEPFIFQRTNHYRNVDVVCKTVVAINLYATVTSIHWMFLQGVYLHGKLTTNVFDKGAPFKVYYAVGWGLPLVLISAWATTMEMFHPKQCWKDYSEQPYIWILLVPMILALVANLLFLINIMRILLTKIQLASSSGDAAQFRRAVKATVLLFPLLGINNLLFLYNPGGQYKRTFVILNTAFQSTQGIFVSVLYCFLSSDVRDAVRRQYRRFAARRSANLTRKTTRVSRTASKYGNGAVPFSMANRETEAQRALFIAPTHFRSKFRKNRAFSADRATNSPSPETVVNNLPLSESPSPPGLIEKGGVLGCGVGNILKSAGNHNNQFQNQVTIPLKEFNSYNKA